MFYVIFVYFSERDLLSWNWQVYLCVTNITIPSNHKLPEGRNRAHLNHSHICFSAGFPATMSPHRFQHIGLHQPALFCFPLEALRRKAAYPILRSQLRLCSCTVLHVIPLLITSVPLHRLCIKPQGNTMGLCSSQTDVVLPPDPLRCNTQACLLFPKLPRHIPTPGNYPLSLHYPFFLPRFTKGHSFH